MKLCYIKDEYIDFLRIYDKRVAENKTESRPYVGVILMIDDVKYYAPLSSPKEKHKYMKNTKDFRKIGHGEYGAINLNNMIPVVDEAIVEFNIGEIEDAKYRRMMQNQYIVLREDEAGIEKAARRLRDLLFADEATITKNDKKIKKRCCNLRLLEKIYKEYV